MNEQQVLETQEAVTLHNKQKQLDYMMQVAVDAIMEAREPNMKPQFIRIGHRVINLARVSSVDLDHQNYNNNLVVAVRFDDNNEDWFSGDDYETAKAFFTSIAQEVK
jgi:hypothetical protein